jgi:tetratricopeptide (TPR) repeat protein
MAARNLIPIHRGRFTEAREGLVGLLSSKEAKRFSAEQIGVIYVAVIIISYEMGDYATMMKYASEYSRQLHKSPFSPLYGRDFVAWALMKGGQTERSLQLFNEIAKIKEEDFPRAHRTTEYLAGLVAYEQGKFEESRTHFAEVLQREFPNHMPQYFYAVALLKTGRTADAIQEFQRMTWLSPISYPPISLLGLTTYMYWPIGAVKAHYWLGVAYEQQGENAKAIKEYESFLETWKDAEKEWPEMADAKARLKLLTMAKH